MDKKEFEVITQGEFDDQGYHVKTFVIRLFGELMNEQIFSTELNCRGCYSTEEEWQEYRATVKARRKQFEGKVRGMLELCDSESFALTQSLSEIFTAVAMYRMGDAPKEET